MFYFIYKKFLRDDKALFVRNVLDFTETLCVGYVRSYGVKRLSMPKCTRGLSRILTGFATAVCLTDLLGDQ